jgi:hypothetical protein
MGNKRNDHKTSLLGAKKEEKPRIIVPLFVTIAQLLKNNRQPCDGWNDVTCRMGGAV